MGTIYGGVQGLKPPNITSDFEEYDKLSQKYVRDVTEYAKRHGDCPEAGEEIYFGVADGNARYVILSLKPVKLIHLAIDDAYQFPYVNRLTATDIRKELKYRKELAKLFSKQRKTVGGN